MHNGIDGHDKLTTEPMPPSIQSAKTTPDTIMI